MPDLISTNWIDRISYARDASIYRLIPAGIARPKNEKEVIELFRYIRREDTSVTFRTAGTSLSGQSVTNGIVAESVRDWKKIAILNSGMYIQLEPGVIGETANRFLAPYQRKIGPDPASIKAAMIGGIVANNASGMCCGTEHNSYHTLKYIRFILPNGNTYDTSNRNDYDRFSTNEKTLSDGLISLKSKIESDENIVHKIRHKYRIKNTIGYTLKALLDYDHPLDIFAHLLIGSEGTLAFISNVTLKTVPDPPNKTTGLILFDSAQKACDFIPVLKTHEADAVELMDYASLSTAAYLKESPYDVNQLSKGSVALLTEFQRNDDEQIQQIMSDLHRDINDAGSITAGGFQTNRATQQKLWDIRKGLYPTVGSLRKIGTSVITEDLCFDVPHLSGAIYDLQDLFKKWAFNDSVIFGHAKDGNLHFVTSVDLESSDGKDRYDGMMNDIVEMTIGKYDGSLKAEHGTGRNMAPFVEMEWGPELTEIMWSIKSLADPEHRLNPGVLLTKDKETHTKNLKTIPKVNDIIDLCVECGFCEKVCPSKELTLTPRQRIILARENANGVIPQKLMKTLEYCTEETCAADGMCETVCPVNIDTGLYIKTCRQDRTTAFSRTIANWTGNHYRFSQAILRSILTVMRLKTTVFGHQILIRLSSFFNKLTSRSTPIWNRHIPGPSPKRIKQTDAKNADYIYFTTCINRIYSAGKTPINLADVIIDISKHVGISIHIPETISDYCCGMPYTSKGYRDTGTNMIEKTIHLLYQSSDSGRIPILIDTSACAYQLIQSGNYLSGEILNKYKKLTFVDIIPFLMKCVGEQPKQKLDRTVILHPTCSTKKMTLDADMKRLAKICVNKVIIPEENECCGFAGDRGLLFPELIREAAKREAASLEKVDPNAIGYSTSRTCEIGMMSATDRPYESIAILVREYLSQN